MFVGVWGDSKVQEEGDRWNVLKSLIGVARQPKKGRGPLFLGKGVLTM